ncbi:hypothetical protein MAAFP003_520, partial [Mycobacterium ahvazicum]
VAGPPDDFNNEPTRYRGVGRGDHPSADEPPPPAPDPAEPPLDPFDEDTEPTPWYRKPVGLIIWGLSVLILIALIVYGIIELIGDQGTSNTPSTHTTTTTTPTTTPTTTSTATTTTTTSPPSATTTTEPPTSGPVESPAPQPTRQEPTRRRHWPSWLPTTIPAIP